MPSNIHGFPPTGGSLQSTGQQTAKKTGIHTLADFQGSTTNPPVPPVRFPVPHNNMRFDTCSSYSSNATRLSKLKAENEKALAKIAELGADVDRLAEETDRLAKETDQLTIQSCLSRWSKNTWSYLSSVGSWVQQKISQLVKWLCSCFKR